MLTLAAGRYYGRFDHRRDLAGFALAHLEAVVPDHDIVPHEHEEAHFICVLEGRYRSTAAGADGVLGAGTVIYNPPGTRHRDRFESGGGRYFALTVGASRLARLAEAGAGGCGARRVADPRAAALGMALASRSGHPGHASALELEELAWQFAAGACDANAWRHRGLPASIRRARELLEDAAFQEIGIEEIAREAGIHPVYLARAFRRHFGMSPGQFQRRARLDRAAALLRSHGAPLSAVAQSCAFADQSHLTRAFRAVYGIPPAVYGRMFRR